VLKNGITMTKMNAWWWLSAPYSVMFPLFVLVFRLKKSIGHAATLFLTTFSSVAWMLVTIYCFTNSRNMELTQASKVKLGSVLLSALLWMALLAGPQ
jgi:hypothetical protein